MRKYRKRRKSYESAGRSPYRRKTGSKIVNGVIIAVVSSMILGILSGIFAPRSQGAAADPTDPTVPPVTDSYIPPSGTLNITSNGLHNVAQYESVNVNVTQTVTGGDCAAEHIISVDVLPTENIDTNAVYLCGGSYYKYGKEFNELLIYMSDVGEAFPLYYLLNMMGLQIDPSKLSYHIAETMPTENIAITDGIENFNVYYIESENNIFVYGDLAETGQNEWVLLGMVFSDSDVPFYGFVNDATEATQEGLYILGGMSWQNYILAQGRLTITENGTYDVPNFAEVNVAVPSDSIFGIWKFNEDGFRPCAGFNANWTELVNFSVIQNNTLVQCVSMGGITKGAFYYTTADGNTFGGYSYPWGEHDADSIVDFGSIPQTISPKFKEFMETNASPIYQVSVADDATISFSISNDGTVTYAARPYMTWSDWVNSAYNIDGYYIQDNKVFTADGSNLKSYPSENVVTPTDIILHNKAYWFVS